MDLYHRRSMNSELSCGRVFKLPIPRVLLLRSRATRSEPSHSVKRWRVRQLQCTSQSVQRPAYSQSADNPMLPCPFAKAVWPVRERRYRFDTFINTAFPHAPILSQKPERLLAQCSQYAYFIWFWVVYINVTFMYRRRAFQ